MTSSSLTKDNCFHEESSQLVGVTSKISSDCPTINFSDMSNLCFKVRLFPVFLMEWKFSEYFFPMNTDDSNVDDINIHQIIELCRWLALHLLENGPISFAIDHSSCARMTVDLYRKVRLCGGVRVHIIVIDDKLVCVLGETLVHPRVSPFLLSDISPDFHSWEDHFSSMFHSE